MRNPKLVANDLVPVYENDHQERIVNARELHEKLMSKQKFADWIKSRINSLDFIENEDFFISLGKSSGGRPSQEYFLRIDSAKEVAMVEHTEQGRAVRQYFIEIEKRYRQKQPQTQAEMMLMFAQRFVDQEREIKELKTSVIETNEKIDNVSNIMTLNPKDWRSEVNKIVNSIGFKLGSDASYQDIRKESYQLLEKRGKCDLDRRLQNRKRNMAFEGESKSKIDKVNKMDVIDSDKRLTAIYLSIVKEMAIKYQVKFNREVV